MGKQFAIYHTSKGKGSGGGLGNHIDRTEGKEHSFKNANSQLTKMNIDFTNEKFKDLTLPKSIEKRLEEGYKSKRKIRTDSVKYLTHIFSGSHEQMIAISKNENALNSWLQKNAQFVKDEFGNGNTIKAVLHMDEKTPHLHIVTVPLTQDGRLSAKEMLGNRKQMQQRQDRYAELMKPLGLERGIKNTGIRHETAQEFGGRVKKADLEIANLKAFNQDKSINLNKTMDMYVNALKKAKIELLDPQRELKTQREIKGGLSR